MQRYAPDSGLVYSETVIKQDKRVRYEPWDHYAKGARPVSWKSPRGPNSLSAIAMRKLVCSADALQPETLRDVPHAVLDKIRVAIRR